LNSLSRFTKGIKKDSQQLNNFKLLQNDFLGWVEYGLKNNFYKVNIASLNLLFSVIDLVVLYYGPNEYKTLANNLIDIIIPIFKANDIDQELKQTVVSTMGNLIKNMGHVITSDKLNLTFSIYLDKTGNENLRPTIFNWLTKIVSNNPNLQIESFLAKFLNPLLENINKNNVILQRQSLDLLTASTINQPNTLKGFDENLAKSLQALITENNLSLFSCIFELYSLIIGNQFSVYKNGTLVESICDDTINSFNLDDNVSTFHSALKFLESAFSYKILNTDKLGKYINEILKFQKFNLTKAKTVAIISNVLGNSMDLVSTIEKKVLFY
jgi:hypothetical protein